MLTFFHPARPSLGCKMRYKSKSKSPVSSKGAGVSREEHTDQTQLLQEGSHTQHRRYCCPFAWGTAASRQSEIQADTAPTASACIPRLLQRAYSQQLINSSELLSISLREAGPLTYGHTLISE